MCVHLWFGLIRSGLEEWAASESQLPATAEDTLHIQFCRRKLAHKQSNLPNSTVILSYLFVHPCPRAFVCQYIDLLSVLSPLLPNSPFQLQSSPSFTDFASCKSFHCFPSIFLPPSYFIEHAVHWFSFSVRQTLSVFSVSTFSLCPVCVAWPF